MNDFEALNRDFNAQLLKLESAVTHLNFREKSIATEWITKLKNAKHSPEELQLRLEFMKYFGKCVGVFNVAPFNNIPPNGPLITMRHLLPQDHLMSCISSTSNAQKSKHIVELFESSADKGTFLSQQPVPRDGTFFIYNLLPAM